MPAHQSHEWVLLALWTPGLGEKERQEGDLARKNWLIIPNFLSTSSPRKALNNFLCLFPDQSPPPPPIPTSLSASKSWGRKLEKIFFFCGYVLFTKNVPRRHIGVIRILYEEYKEKEVAQFVLYQNKTMLLSGEKRCSEHLWAKILGQLRGREDGSTSSLHSQSWG